jgi:outer membrane protein TolC
MPRSSWISSGLCAVQTKAARAPLLATEDARQVVVLRVVSDVATDYFTLLQLDLQLQIARRDSQDTERFGQTDSAAERFFLQSED